MPQLVIFPNEFGRLSIITPIEGTGIPIEQIALKDVPPDRPFLIIDSSDLPEDGQYRDAWEADFSTPDGYGIGHAAWEQLNANR
jgi:hypothetical protein